MKNIPTELCNYITNMAKTEYQPLRIEMDKIIMEIRGRVESDFVEIWESGIYKDDLHYQEKIHISILPMYVKQFIKNTHKSIYIDNLGETDHIDPYYLTFGLLDLNTMHEDLDQSDADDMAEFCDKAEDFVKNFFGKILK